MAFFIQNKLLQYVVEAAGIIAVTYFAFLFIPNLPWWAVALTAGIMAFLLNTKAKSFLTGFAGIAVLWFFLAYQLNTANGGLLAGKMATLFSASAPMELTPTHLMYATAAIGGLVGGLGAMTGNYARKLFSSSTTSN
ncbi:MAG: hypothetical protein AB8G22_09230 [Saprospiraceae bacterium]